jgi:hypothetical protein
VSLSADALARAFPGDEPTWEGDDDIASLVLLMAAGSTLGAAAIVAAGLGLVHLASWPYRKMVEYQWRSYRATHDWLTSLW